MNGIKGKRLLVIGIILIAVLAAGLGYFILPRPLHAGDRISLPTGVGLCSASVLGALPYLSAAIDTNGTSSISTLSYYINGTYEGTTHYFLNLTSYRILLMTNPTDPSMPIVAGRHYEVIFVAIFRDGVIYSTSAEAISC